MTDPSEPTRTYESPPPPPPPSTAPVPPPAVTPAAPRTVSRTVTRRRRHPFVGLIGGFLLGCGVALLLITYSQAPLGVATPYVVIILFVILGLLWGLFAPTRGRRPATTEG